MRIYSLFVIAISLVACGQNPVLSQISDEDQDQPVYTADNCLGEQDLDAADVDVSNCPALPNLPDDVMLGDSDTTVSLGAWELGQTAEGDVYKYGPLSDAGEEPRVMSYYGEEGFTVVNESNLTCWAKGYYRLRKLLQDPPAEYMTLRLAGFQVRFFQFQTDLRNGPTGYREISSFRDHLVKWVTVIEQDGTCVQPTRQKFVDYVRAELTRRGIEQ